MSRSVVLTRIVGIAVVFWVWPVVGLAQHRPQDEPDTPIPPITEADRAAAFPEVDVRPMEASPFHSFLLLDELEWRRTAAKHGMKWDALGWLGGDLNRFWFRTEGLADDGRLGEAEAHLLYGRAFARWWDLVVGVRQDFRPGPSQTWAAVGVQGLAPYWFEVEATGYLGEGEQTAARLEVEYELLLTNRLILQPLLEINVYGKRDLERGIGAGLSTGDLGLRLRYEVRRELAPYVGVTWSRRFGETRSLAAQAGDVDSGARVVAGVRLWY